MNSRKSTCQKGAKPERAHPRMSTFTRVHVGEILHQEARNARRQHLARSLWESGPRPVLEALLEVEAGRPLELVLERYARIPAHIYRALGVNALRPQIHRIKRNHPTPARRKFCNAYHPTATEQGTEARHDLKISHSVTSDSPDGRPWPPSDSNALWVIVRRAQGYTLWRAIQLAEVRPLPRTFAISQRQQPQ
jgi:hypothetical protein